MNKTLKNLKKALVELPKAAEKYPHIITDFSMMLFGCVAGEYSKKAKKPHLCETSGCLLGNMVYVFPPKPADFGILRRFEYDNFNRRVFPNAVDGNNLWLFLFSDLWEYTYPTFQDAMTRLQYVVDNWDWLSEGNFEIDWENQKCI